MGLRGLFFNLTVFACCLAFFLPAGYGWDLADEVRGHLRIRVDSADTATQLVVARELILAPESVAGFYKRRAFRPAWMDGNTPSPLADALVAAVKQADGEGLDPRNYHLERLEAMLAEAWRQPLRPAMLANLDILLTDAYILYASHLLAGQVSPEAIGTEWYLRRPDADLKAILQKALKSGSIEESLNSLLPADPGYGRLKEALRHYREIRTSGGWPAISEGPVLRLGDTGPRVTELRARLTAGGDVVSGLAEGKGAFDEEVEQAVIRFQQSHGLDADGAVGEQTLAALNVPAEEREKQILVNLERLRWLPSDLGNRHILVNVAGFSLHVIEGGETLMGMRAIVGRPYRQTPSFSGKLTHLVFSPYWHIPHSIAVKDLLPKIQKDRRFLAREKIRVFRGRGKAERQINPSKIKWQQLSENNFPYHLRQDPGPHNSLGRVKFMLPNNFNVYIHDTPSRELFNKAVRGFSSGCIRIDSPVELAEYLLRDDPSWTAETILEAMEQPQERTVRLPRPIPVHFLYMTAWVDAEGVLQFRDDIYSRDALVAAALMAPPPSRKLVSHGASLPVTNQHASHTP